MIAAAETGVASTRMIRVMALTEGVAAAVFGALAAPSILAQWTAIPAWWTLPAIAVVFVPGLVLIPVALPGPMGLVRGLLHVIAGGYLVAMATFPLAMAGNDVPVAAASPWILTISTVGTAAAAIAWRPVAAWGAVVVSTVLLGVDRVVASSQSILDIASQDALFSCMFDTVFTALGLALRRAARMLDDAAADADAEARSASIAEARARERGRVEALVHDTVLVALLASARAAPGELVAGAARRAIAQIDVVENRDEDRAVDSVGLVWAVQAVATELAPDAFFDYTAEGDHALPPAVAEGVVEATAEALRNSIVHAGDDAHRAVHVATDDRGIEVTVLDDGRGFDPAGIEPARLGISVSIVGRMRAVDGNAVVVSETGVGTRVVLTWIRPEHPR